MTRVTLAMLLAAGAFAQSDRDKAKQIFTDGETAYRLGNYEDAAKKYEEAYRLAQIPIILFNIGQASRRAFEQSHNLEQAHRAVEVYKAFLRDDPQSARRKEIEHLVQELEGKIRDIEQQQIAARVREATGVGVLRLAEEMLGRGMFKDAESLAESFLRTGAGSREDTAAGYRVRAFAAGAQDDGERAKQFFLALLALRPEYKLLEHDLPPTTQKAYEEARGYWQSQPKFGISHVPRGGLRVGQSAEIVLRVDGDPLSLIAAFEVRYRRQGSDAFSEARSEKPTIMIPDSFVKTLPAGTWIEYYLIARDRDGAPLLQLARAERPYSFAILGKDGANIVLQQRAAPPPGPPWYRRWWVWAAAGAVVVGATTAILIAKRPESPERPDNTIPVRFE